MKLETKRLILRKPKPSDWKDVFEACQDGSIANNTAKVPFPYTKKDAKWFVNDSINNWKRKKHDYRFFIELKSEKKIIGVLEIFKIKKFLAFHHGLKSVVCLKLLDAQGFIHGLKAVVPEEFRRNSLYQRTEGCSGFSRILGINKIDEKAETGSWMHPKYRKKGFMSEAKIAVNEFAFNKLKLNKLETGVFSFNKASKATQKAMSYKYEGTRIKTIKNLKTGKLFDEHLYGLLRKDWKRNIKKLKRKLASKIKTYKLSNT